MITNSYLNITVSFALITAYFVGGRAHELASGGWIL